MAQTGEIQKSLSRTRILIPIILGLAVAVYMVYGALTQVEFREVLSGQGTHVWKDANANGIVDFKDEAEFVLQSDGNFLRENVFSGLGKVHWTWTSTLFLFCALIMMVVRDAAYMWRIRVLTDKALSWRQSFRVIMIWEFASAMTPGVVGGAAVAMFILNREKVNMGKATALVMITALLDELFYILIVPVLIMIAGTAALFPIDLTRSVFGMELHIQGIFWLAFGVITLITVMLFVAVFLAPNMFKRLLVFFTRLPFLHRFRDRAEKTGNDIVLTSTELRGKQFSFWMQAFLATIFSWTARFLVINFIIMAFNPLADQFIIFARQLSMWVILIVSPTPGGSGIAEFVFSGFLSEFIPFGLAGILAVLWRLISYYPYLFIGAIVLPRWLGKSVE
jgi:uncharacterized protein (TIRG00374 family)